MPRTPEVGSSSPIDEPVGINPEIEVGSPFDAEREITQADWQEIMLHLEKFKGDVDRDIEMAANVKLLNPEADLNISQASISSFVEKYKEKNNGHLSVDLITEMKILGLGQYFNLGQGVPEEAKRNIGETRLTALRKPRYWTFFSVAASDAKIVDPSFNLGLDQTAVNGIKGQIEEYRKDSRWDGFGDVASNARIIGLDQVVQMDSTTWRELRNELGGARWRNDWDSFIILATQMKILAAKKVEVTEKGLELTK